MEKEIRLTFQPRDYQLPICDAIENKGYKRVLAIMPRRCLSGRTHIILSDGSYKCLSDIKPGDSILSWNGEKYIPDKVKNVWGTGTKMSYKLSSYQYPGVVASNEHSFAKFEPTSSSVVFAPMDNLSLGDSVLLYAGVEGDDFGSKSFGRLESELIGYSLSSCCKTCLHNITFKHRNREVLERIEFNIAQAYGVDPSWRESRGMFTLLYAMKPSEGREQPMWALYDFVTTFNPPSEISSDHKYLYQHRHPFPTVIWTLSRESIFALLRGLALSDGEIYSSVSVKGSHVSQRKERHNNADPHQDIVDIYISDVSGYIWDFYWLFRKLGIAPEPPLSMSDNRKLLRIFRKSDVDLFLRSGVFYGHEERQNRVFASNIAQPREVFKGNFLEPFYTIPYAFDTLYDLETETNGNFIANGYLVHNSGKDIVAFNLAIRQCLRKPCVVYYIFPTYAQAKKVIWDSITNTGQRILDYIPSELVEQKNSQEMKVRFANGSLLQLIGSDRFDSILGTNPQACVFSEYALQDPRAYQFIRPILVANDGWALFESTPRGKNHLWDMYQIASHSPLWFCYKLTIEDTKHISLAAIEQERQEGIMSEDLIQQEYYTSFSLGVEGSYYLKYFDRMRLNNQIGAVPWEPSFKVHTAWDLGVRDSTSIIFFQVIGQTIRIIDFYENSKEGLEHYIKILREKPYDYGKHIAPHDIRVREFSSGITRFDKARQLGIVFSIAPNIPIMDGIEQVRTTLPKCWIDDRNCVKLIKALENYRQEYDNKRKVYMDKPLHDWSSHAADCMRYLALSLSKTRDSLSPEDLDKRYREAVYGSQSNMPSVFRDDLPSY